jgi:hypothetical protein
MMSGDHPGERSEDLQHFVRSRSISRTVAGVVTLGPKWGSDNTLGHFRNDGVMKRPRLCIPRCST